MTASGPAEAALRVARGLGLPATDAHVVGSGTHVLVRLEPELGAARVTGEGLLARFAGDLDTEVRLAAELHRAGAPVVPPLPGVPARAYGCEGRMVTLWTWWPRSVVDEGPEAMAQALAACHGAMARGVGVELRPWAKLAAARGYLPELGRRERAILAPRLEPHDATLQPVHGDAHFGNVLGGPVWHDWEARSSPASTAQQAVCGLLVGDAIAGLRERVAVRLEWLAERTAT